MINQEDRSTGLDYFSNPWPWVVTAQYMTAPAAIAMVLKTIPVRPISCASNSFPWPPAKAKEAGLGTFCHRV